MEIIIIVIATVLLSVFGMAVFETPETQKVTVISKMTVTLAGRENI
jgi:hypothetical protein